MAVLGLLVQLEVRRADDYDRVGADLRGMSCERDGVSSRLRAAVDGDPEAVVCGLEEEIRHAATLGDAQEDPFARRSQREQPVQPLPNEEVGEGAERVLVDLAPVLAQRRDGGGEHAAQPLHQR